MPASRTPNSNPNSKPPSTVPDVLAPDLRVVFCGINPGRWSAAAGAHFANPRNDFWRLLHDAGFTPRLLAPAQQHELPLFGYGLTNAALRMTRGSGDLRRGDFAGSAERLERIVRELRPAWIAFVGKEAYRGAFGERPELGVQKRRLADTQLFVLPSTSPANAAVPYAERLRWFQELAGRSTGKPLREAVRAIVIDPTERVLLVRFEAFGDTWWCPPGGGVETDESPEQAIVRELAEESGLDAVDLGPCIWTRTHWFAGMARHGGQTERIYLVRSGEFEPAPASLEELAAEGVVEQRWWTIDEIESSDEAFAPTRLAELLRELDEQGPPAEPIDVGV